MPIGNPSLRLGSRRYDLTRRCLVMGILNRTPDSFYDQGATFALDRMLRRAETLVAEGADILDVGGVKAGPGRAVGEEEELDRVVPAVEALVARFDVPVSADTWNPRVLAAACAAGAVVGNDISGFGDPDYLAVSAVAGATVVATHIRLAPRVPDPEPEYDDVVATVQATVTNTGDQPGKEIAQLYLTDPAAADEPVRQLRGVQPITLKPRERTTVTFDLTARYLAYYSDVDNRWHVAPGSYGLSVGNSSAVADLPLRDTLSVR